jgi:hypothetical protein
VQPIGDVERRYGYFARTGLLQPSDEVVNARQGHLGNGVCIHSRARQVAEGDE